MTMMDVSNRQPAVQAVYKYFAYDHLPEDKQAKDCFVRASIDKRTDRQ